MARTKIVSRNLSSFVQPPLEGTVSVVVHTQIDWARTGIWMYIAQAGVYEIISITGEVYVLKLKTAEALPGTPVKTNILYPVNKSEETAYTWGAKEW